MTGCKFNVGDWVKFVERGRPYKILEINRDFPSQQISYLLMELSGNSSYYNKNYVDNSCHLWSLKDARLGDILYLDDNNIVVFKNLYNSTTFHSVCFIEDGVFSVREDWWNGEGFCPATEKQCGILFQKMKEYFKASLGQGDSPDDSSLTDVGHEYFSDLLKDDRSYNINNYAYHCSYCMSHDWARETPTWEDVERACKLGALWGKSHHGIPLTPTGWGQENQERINRIYDFLWKNRKGDTDEIYRQEQDANWLKTLDPRVDWKPSETQLEALESLISGNPVGGSQDCLWDLLIQLKALL